MRNNHQKRFLAWPDKVITPSVELAILGNTTWLTLMWNEMFHWHVVTNIIVWIGIETALALLVLFALRKIFPLKSGIYSLRQSPWVYYNYKLQGFIHIFNLFHIAFPQWLPFPLRKMCYSMLGVKFGPGIHIVAGQMGDPFSLIEIGESAMIGYQSVLLPHYQLVVDGEDMLILRPIRIEKNAVIGANAILSPGVVVGEGAMVNALSLVPMNTIIAPGEVWGGNPAVKIKSVPPAASSTTIYRLETGEVVKLP